MISIKERVLESYVHKVSVSPPSAVSRTIWVQPESPKTLERRAQQSLINSFSSDISQLSSDNTKKAVSLSSVFLLAVEKQVGLLSESFVFTYILVIFIVKVVPLADFTLCVGDIVAAG